VTLKKPESHEQEPVQIIQRTVNIVLVGGGPATLGLLCNAQRSNRYVIKSMHFNKRHKREKRVLYFGLLYKQMLSSTGNVCITFNEFIEILMK